MIDGRKLAERVSNIVDMTVDERSALLRVARAGNVMIEDVVPVPYKGYEVGRETFEKFVEALKEVEHLL